MSDQGDEGQVPEPPGLEGRGELPPRPTVRESFRRGLFVRLPGEGEAEQEPAGTEQVAEEQGQGLADQYPEQVADPYPGWRQAADGSWEAVSPEAIAYAESSEPAAPAAYPEIDQNANFASIAGGEPFIHEETDVPAWTFASEQDFSQVADEAIVPVAPQSAEIVSGVMPEEVVAETVPEATPEPTPEAAEVAETAPSAEPVFEAAPPEPAAEVVVSDVAPSAEPAPEIAPEPVAEVVAAPEAVAAALTPSREDPVAGTGLYIPSDVELLEGDMLVYGEQENVPPRFAGSGLGEPFFIDFGDLARTLTGLRRLLPKGTRLTYNYDYERAWVRTGADIDLPSFAERIDAPAAEGETTSS